MGLVSACKLRIIFLQISVSRHIVLATDEYMANFNTKFLKTEGTFLKRDQGWGGDHLEVFKKQSVTIRGILEI